MKRLLITLTWVLCFICFASYSIKAQTPLLYETFGDASNLFAKASAINTEFNSASVAIKRKNLASNQRLGQLSNSAILTSDVSAFSSSFQNPSNSNDNYLIVEPGAKGNGTTPGLVTPASPDPFISGYVTSLIWSETFSSGLSHDDLFDFNMRATKLFPQGTTVASHGSKASVRVVARTTNGSTTSDVILTQELLNNLTTSFSLVKKYGFQLLTNSAEIRIELVYQQGDIITLGLDDIYFGKVQLFKMNAFEYCVLDQVLLEDLNGGINYTCPTNPPNASCIYNIYKDGGTTPYATPLTFNAFATYSFQSSGEYTFEMIAENHGISWSRGSESPTNLKTTSVVTVYDKPTRLSGHTIAFDDIQMDDLKYAFINRVEQGDGIGFIWDFGDGTTSTLPNPAHIFDETQTTTNFFNVKLEVYNVLPTCSITDNRNIEICTASNRPTFSFSATEDIPNKKVIIAGISAGFPEYTWTYGDNRDGQTMVINSHPDIVYSSLGKYVIRCKVKSGVCSVEHEEIIQLCETVTPSVDHNECEDEFTFSVNSNEYTSLRWMRKPIELSTQTPFVYSPTAKRETVWAMIHNGCEPTETPFVLERKGPPHSGFIAMPKGGNLEMTVEEISTGADYAWTVDAYDESSNLLETLSYTTASATYTLHGDAVSVVVSLTATYSNTSCSSTTQQTICIPSSTHDCCETCSGS